MFRSKRYSGFDPRTLGNCALWLDAADTRTLTLSGSNVTAWADKSPTATALTISNGTGGGTIVQTTYGGLPVVQFSNSCFFNGTVSFPLATRSIFFIVAEVVHSDWRGLISFSPPGGSDWNQSNTYVITSTNTVGSNVQFSQNQGNGGFVYNYNAGNGTTVVPFMLYEDVTSNTAVNIYIGGSNAYSTTTSVTPSASTGFTVAGRSGGTASAGVLAVAEVLLFNRTLSTAERQQVEGYLSWKWGISSSFQPTSISGLSLWLDAADSTTLTLSGSNVTQWRDKSSNAYVANSPVSNAPAITTTINSRPVVSSANGKFLTLSNFNQSFSTTTVFYVIRPTEDITTLNKSPSGYPYYGIFVGQATNNLQLTFSYDNPTQTGSTNYFYAALNKSGATLLRGLLGTAPRSSYNPLNQTILITQVLTGLASTNTSFSNATSLTTAGADGTLNSLTISTALIADGFGKDLAEVIFYGGVLTTDQRQQVEDYLSRKWNVSLSRTILNLPSSHPFRLAPPVLRPFVPTDIANCALWLDAADPRTMTFSGSNVTAWADKSGNGRDATATTAPSYLSNGVYFTSNQRLASSLTASSTTESAFIVCKFDNFSNGNTLLGGSTVGGGRQIRVNGGVIQTNKQNVIGVVFTGATLASNTTHLVEFVNNASTLTHYWNGATYASGSSVAYDAGITTTIGSCPVNAVDYMNGFLYEIVVFSAALSTTQRQQVESYLANKWGLQGTTPSTHPARISPGLSPQFMPSLLSGCILWLDAADATVFNGGATWTDKSGTANHATNGTPGASSMPTIAKWTNGLPVARFVAASKNSIKTTNTIPNLNVTYFVVLRITEAISSGGRIMINDFDGMRQLNANGSTTFPVTLSGQASTSGVNLVTVNQSVGAQICATVASGATGFAGYGNGTLGGTASTTTSSASKNYFGSANGDSGYLSGDIGEILIYNTVLSTADRQQVEGYLATKWGLQGSLPSTHPYKLTTLL